MRLRDALGDSAETSVFIETLARRGYRFVAPVIKGAALSAPQPRTLPLRTIYAMVGLTLV